MTFLGICIITDDVVSLSEFYINVLQATADVNDVHTEIIIKGAALSIYSRSAAEKDMSFNFEKYSGNGKVTLNFNVDDVDLEYERLKALGVEFITTPTTYPWGNRAVHFRDADGNIVGFSSFWKIN